MDRAELMASLTALGADYHAVSQCLSTVFMHGACKSNSPLIVGNFCVALIHVVGAVE